MNIGEQIKKLRKNLDLTQQKFGERIGIKGNTVAQYELGRNEPIDAVISLICREFHVNENWLRTGDGDMFQPEPTDYIDTLASAYHLSVPDQILLRKFISMTPEDRAVITGYIIDTAKTIMESNIFHEIPDNPAELEAGIQHQHTREAG